MGHKIRTKSERLAFLEQFRSSGLTQQAFALREGIAPGTFHGWLHGRGVGDTKVLSRPKQIRLARVVTRQSVPAASSFTQADSGGDVIAAPLRGRLPFAKLNAVGREYQTWLMTSAILMPKLVEDLKLNGVHFEERTFQTPVDVATLPQSIIFNCTGYGSRQLFDDSTLIAQRGHNVVLKKTQELQHYF